MKIAPLADVKARLSAYVDDCGANGPIVITRNGKAVAVLLVPTDDDDSRTPPPRTLTPGAIDPQSIAKASPKEKVCPKDEFWKAVEGRTQSRKKREP